MKFIIRQNLKKCKLFGISFLLLLSACVAVTPPDVPVFESLTSRVFKDESGHIQLKPSQACMNAIGETECGHGVFIVSKREIFVGDKEKNWYNKKPWSQLQKESVHVPAVESWAPLSQYIINSCNRNHCNDQVDRFKVSLPSIDGIIDALKNNIK